MAGERVYTICEAGSAWRFGPVAQHLSNARRMIELAYEAGGSAVKFQYCSNPERIAERRGEKASAFEVLRYPVEWLDELSLYCFRKLDFMCTAFIPEDIETVSKYTQHFKIAARESHDREFVEAHQKYDRLMVISWGAGTTPIHYVGARNLHCIGKYPAPLEQLNLSRIRESNPRLDGFSNHCPDPRVGGFAVAAGAKWIETHFRLDETPTDNDDFPHSLNPAQLVEFLRNVRDAEAAL